MKTLKRLFVFLLVLIVVFSVYVATRPAQFNFERSRTVQAPASVLFNKVNDFKNWPDFSPWIEQEPGASLNFSDHTVGEGSSYSWVGEILGEGRMKTNSVKKNKEISQTINFIKPFEATSNVNWFFEPTNEGTKVTWQMDGEKDFISKLYTVIMGPIEDSTGPDFERGLFKLDSIVQADMNVYSINVDGVVEHSGGFYLYKTTSCKMSQFQSQMEELMPEIGAYAISNNISFAGKPFVLYHKWDEANDAVIFSTCIPTTTKVISSEPDILTGQLAPFKAVKTTLVGNYDHLKEAWEETMSYIAAKNLEIQETGSMLETYVTDPDSTPNPAEWVTEIYAAIK